MLLTLHLTTPETPGLDVGPFLLIQPNPIQSYSKTVGVKYNS